METLNLLISWHLFLFKNVWDGSRQKKENSFQITFHTMPPDMPATTRVHQRTHNVEPNEIAGLLTQYWAPFWQNKHEIDQADGWEEFQQLLDLLPIPPYVFSCDDSTDAWMSAVAKLNPKTGKGIDAVSAQELKLLPREAIACLLDVCNLHPNGFPERLMIAKVCPLNKT